MAYERALCEMKNRRDKGEVDCYLVALTFLVGPQTMI